MLVGAARLRADRGRLCRRLLDPHDGRAPDLRPAQRARVHQPRLPASEGARGDARADGQGRLRHRRLRDGADGEARASSRRARSGEPDKRVYFSQSGAAAIEAAIKGARQHRYVVARREPGASMRRSSIRIRTRSSRATARGTARRRRGLGERRSAPLVPGTVRRAGRRVRAGCLCVPVALRRGAAATRRTSRISTT